MVLHLPDFKNWSLEWSDTFNKIPLPNSNETIGWEKKRGKLPVLDFSSGLRVDNDKVFCQIKGMS